MTWRMLDLFSGIGGFSLAAQWCWGDELEIVAFCEIDKFCQKVLKKHWPDVPIIEDVRDVGEKIISNLQSNRLETGRMAKEESKIQPSRNSKTPIELLTGGFPCQPFSCAGKRKGKEDNRFLWPEMLRVIKETRPRWIVAENVAGIIRMALDDCLSDLESEGYSAGMVIIPACAVNAPHRRDRVWIVAYNPNDNRESCGTIKEIQEKNSNSPRICQDVADVSKQRLERQWKPSRSESTGLGQGSWWSTEPNVGRVAHGVPNRVDRLKALGNAIVPQVAYQIFKAIKEIERRG